MQRDTFSQAAAAGLPSAALRPQASYFSSLAYALSPMAKFPAAGGVGTVGTVGVEQFAAARSVASGSSLNQRVGMPLINADLFLTGANTGVNLMAEQSRTVEKAVTLAVSVAFAMAESEMLKESNAKPSVVHAG